MRNKKLTILLIIFLALFFRFWQIDSLPPLNRDEVAIGYNAYSILKTGKDEWGEFLPLSFKSFGDYKMPGYIYATVLPVKILGLTEFAVRFWSAMGGAVAVIALYYLSLWVFKELDLVRKREKWVALIPAFVLATNPWHLYFSRVGFEANLNLTLFIVGLTAFLYGLKRRRLLSLSALSFALTFYTYSSSFIFLPIFLLILGFLFAKELFGKRDKWLILALIILSLGFIHGTWSVWQVSEAKTNITIFSDPGILDNFNKVRLAAFRRSPLLAKLWLNKPFFYLRVLMGKYLLSFSPKFLVISGGAHPWHQVPGMGHFYWTDIVLMVLGLWLLLCIKARKIKWLILGWFLVSPLPSAITVDAPHATRMLQLAPAMVMLISLGLLQLWEWLLKKKEWIKATGLSLLIILYAFQIGRFGYLYFFDYPKKLPALLMSGIDKAIGWLEEQDQGDDRLIIFSSPLDFPYIYVAFHTQMDPVFFQENSIWKPPDLANLTAVEQIGKYRFWEGVPEVDKKAFYVLQKERKSPANSSLTHQIKRGEKIEWSIHAN